MSTLRWTSAHDPDSVCGVALAIHGLNYDPTRMQPVVDCLTTSGYDCLTLSLHGHGENYEPQPGVDANVARLCSFARVTFDLWLDEAQAAYTLARLRADRFGVPLLLTGYSLGGLTACALLATREQVRADGLLLFAPSLAVAPHDLLFQLAEILPRGVLPSFSPRQYRANRGTPGAAYAALYAGIALLDDENLERLNIPAAVFMGTRDEVVSYAGVRAIADKLSNWTFHVVEKSDGTNGRVYNHLLIGETAVGDSAWRQIVQHISAFLESIKLHAK
jgi:esterase/lipase